MYHRFEKHWLKWKGWKFLLCEPLWTLSTWSSSRPCYLHFQSIINSIVFFYYSKCSRLSLNLVFCDWDVGKICKSQGRDKRQRWRANIPILPLSSLLPVFLSHRVYWLTQRCSDYKGRGQGMECGEREIKMPVYLLKQNINKPGLPYFFITLLLINT